MIAVFGAGAIGCWFGGKLAAAGHDVVLIGRAHTVRELAGGLTISELGGETVTLPPSKFRVTTDPAVVAETTHVLVTVKSAQTREAGEALANVLRTRTSIVSLQNGVRNASVLRDALPDHAIAAGMVPFNVARRGPGQLHRATSGVVLLERERLAGWLATALNDAGVPTELRDDMLAVQWAKLVMNLNNAINALSGKPLAAELSERAYRRCLAACQREALALLDEAQLPIAKLTVVPPRWMPRMLELPDRVFRALAKQAIAIDPHARSSMWDDLEAGRPTEIDYLQGEVVALAERLGRRAPANAALVRLVRAAEAGGKRDFTGRELCRAVLER